LQHLLPPSRLYQARPLPRVRASWKTDQVVGIGSGAVIGGVLGNVIAGRGDKTLGTVISGAGGAVVGNQVTKPSRDCRSGLLGYYEQLRHDAQQGPALAVRYANCGNQSLDCPFGRQPDQRRLYPRW
jgi:hypothetical protein